jgi:hypothetical protein
VNFLLTSSERQAKTGYAQMFACFVEEHNQGKQVYYEEQLVSLFQSLGALTSKLSLEVNNLTKLAERFEL